MKYNFIDEYENSIGKMEFYGINPNKS